MLPVTSIELEHEVSKERISTGVAGLDEMLGGKGFWRGSSILVSGMAGTGKSSMAAHFVDGACRRGEKAVYFAFEESPHQIVRNMRSIGIDLQQWVDAGLFVFRRRGRRSGGSRCISPACTRRSSSSIRRSWSSIRSIISAPSAPPMKCG